MYDYLIVGSGLFGSVFAHEAVSAGKKCLVVDRRDTLGGNVYCDSIEGITVHRYGAHIFHTNDRRVWEYVTALADFNRFTNSPVANFNGEIYNLPFNMNTFNRMWGVKTPEEARAVIKAQQAEYADSEPVNLEEQALRLVGRDIYEKLIKGYTEKQWGRKCSELPPFIIKRLPVRFTYDNNYFSDRFQGIPEGGYNVIIKKLLADCDIQTGVDFNLNRDQLRGLARTVVYTGTIDSYFDYRLGRLEYRSLRFETEVLDTDNYQGVAVVNYTDAETPFTRIIEHKHFEFGAQPKTVISHEYPDLYEPGKEPYYPVNDEKNQTLYTEYAKLAANEKNVIFGGRLAEYKYYDMDKVIASALNSAEKYL
ncbi:MAG: UDP-galactopyranose mutase [Clostridia bacterium]|nr:UDP-galactopyranose mutase [Clostridia bacterium]